MVPFGQLYAKNWIGRNSDDVSWYYGFREALVVLVDSGTQVDAQNAQMALMLIPPDQMRYGKCVPQVVRMGDRIVFVVELRRRKYRPGV